MTGLLRKLSCKENFSANEKVIADYIMKNFREIPNLSTRQLANETFCSSAAIVRFTQKLGFEGYSDFKTKFLAEMMQYIGEPKEKFITDKDNIDSIIEKVTCIAIDALKDTRNRINPTQFLRAMNYLSVSEHVDFYAMNNNLNLARMAAENFIMANKYSTVHSSTSMQYLQSYSVPKSHISFIISRTGENRILVDIAEILRAKDSTIFCITSEANSKIARLSKVIFEVATSDKMEELGPRVFTLGAKYVIDILFALLMSKNNYQELKKKEEWLKKNFRY
ncbi:MAG: MurR/RpiR family transcriptional regulator [Selenomonadaceae bacterium]|nr:MurR/RpiR family transcriptional regulator [Selenomonadaceae bacterium]